MNLNKPVYDFVGYKLLTTQINRASDDALDFIAIKTSNGILDQNNIYTITITVVIKYYNNSQSELIFESDFKINDHEWYNQIKSPISESLFLSVTFPYIREKIYAITNDSRGPLIVPIIDLRNINILKGIKLSPNYNSNNEKNNSENVIND